MHHLYGAAQAWRRIILKPSELKICLRDFAKEYAKERGLPIDTSHSTAIIFLNLKDNFEPESFERIYNNKEWYERTQKKHPNVKDAFEMQSSNSSDALLMSIFCHPRISKWKGVSNALGVNVTNPIFGFKPYIPKTGGRFDSTEIDIALDEVFIEAKLTETDFTQKSAFIVEDYEGFLNVFHKNHLKLRGNKYENYQVIRNILAAIQYDKRHILLCDERRPDLARSYFETVNCIRDITIRKRFRVVFWQEIQRGCGVRLNEYLKIKYGIC